MVQPGMLRRVAALKLPARIVTLACLLACALAACAPAATPFALPYVVTVTEADTLTPALGQPALSTPLAQDTDTDTPAPQETPTIDLSATPAEPTATDTLLPPLELPTEKSIVPAQLAWTGEPTYAGDSQPGRLFRLDYDPSTWAQTGGDYGDVVLAHRQIQYCTITPWSGRGLPADWKVEHSFHQLGNVPYDVNSVIGPDGALKYVTYVGGDQILLTGFQVAFQEQQDKCIQDAETVLATLRSFAAQPTITPTFTLEPSATP